MGDSREGGKVQYKVCLYFKGIGFNSSRSCAQQSHTLPCRFRHGIVTVAGEKDILKAADRCSLHVNRTLAGNAMSGLAVNGMGTQSGIRQCKV